MNSTQSGFGFELISLITSPVRSPAAHSFGAPFVGVIGKNSPVPSGQRPALPTWDVQA